MKTSRLLFLTVLLAGCGERASDSGQTNASAAGGSVITAPVDYLGAVGKAQQSAIKTIDTAAITSAIQLFQVEHGRFPKDLNELVKEKYLSEIPPAPFGSKIVYDASTGQVKIVKQ
jgi:hypothetical protein